MPLIEMKKILLLLGLHQILQVKNMTGKHISLIYIYIYIEYIEFNYLNLYYDIYTFFMFKNFNNNKNIKKK